MRRVTLSELDYGDDGLYYLDGVAFTGTIMLLAKDGSGREKGFMECRDGLRWGATRETYPDGGPMVEAHHLRGVLHGRAREWHRNGQLAEDGEYEYGFALWAKEWDETGRLVTERRMVDGDDAHARLAAARALYGASGHLVTTDHSQGWEAVADEFMTIRSEIGAGLVRAWARECLAPSSSIVDVGCGSGHPIAKALADDGFAVFGIDASPSLVAAFRENLPAIPVACERAQHSAFFDRTFEGAVSIGLLFLLDAIDQRMVLGKIASALDPGGRFLFSAPRQACEWNDTLTGRVSRSLGADAYATHLNEVGLDLVRCLTDDGGNDYHDAVKRR